MKRFSALAFRNLWSRKLRTLVTGVGIVLGVATVLAFGITNATVEVSLNDFFSQAAGDAALTITSSELNHTFRARALGRAAGFPDVRLAVGSLWQAGTAFLPDEDQGLTLVGIDPASDPLVRTYELAAGRMVAEADRTYTIVLAQTFADDHSLGLGDDVEIGLGPGRVETFEVVGLLASEGAARTGNGAVGFLRLDLAQDLFDSRGRLSQIDLVLAPAIGTDAAALERFKGALGDHMGASYHVRYPAAIGQALTDSMAGLRTGFDLFSIIALFVGGLLIYNTFAMTVAERTAEIGLLRALGATQGQILRLVLAEALLLACIGSALGLGLGVFLAIPLVQIFARFLDVANITLDRFVVPPASIVQASVLGLGATLAAAFTPAWRAGRISPVEAMRIRGESQSGFLAGHGWKLGLALIAIPLGLHRTPLWDRLPDAAFFLLVTVGGTLAMPLTIKASERATRRVLTLIYGPTGGLGSRNLNRARLRTSLTIGVLMLGATMTISIGALQKTFDSAITSWLETAVGGDLTVASELTVTGGSPGDNAPRYEFARQLMALPGVELATPINVIPAEMVGFQNSAGYAVENTTVGFQAVELPAYRQVAGFQFVADAEWEEEILARLSLGDALLVSSSIADKYHLRRGDSIRLRTRRGERNFEVAGIITNLSYGGLSVVGTWNDMEQYLGNDRGYAFLIKLSPGAEADAVREVIKTRLISGDDLSIASSVEFRETLGQQSRGFLTIFNVVVYIAILVAGLGVINTMTMNILDRVREIGVLRSMGMTRGQVARMVLAEAAAMGVIGGAFGLGLGWLVAEDLVQAMSRQSGWHFDYIHPTTAFFSAALTALVISQLAALYPVWRAGRLRITAAIGHE